MAELLVHKKFDGEPIGILNDSGQVYYAPGFEDEVPTGKYEVESKGWAIPWSVFVHQRADSVNFTDWWGVLDTTDDLPVALEGLRDRFFAQQAAEGNPDA